MLNREQAQALARKVLSQVDAEQAEVIIHSTRTNSTRFSGNVITQNVGLANDSLRLRVMLGGRQGVASVNQFDDDSIRRCIRSALAVAHVSAEDPALLPMVDTQPEYAPTRAWHEATANFTPAQRAEAVGRVLADYDRRGIEGAGIFDTAEGAVCFANSRGVFGHKAGTKAEFSISAFLDDGTVEGWAENFDLDVSRLDAAATGRRAADKALSAREPRDLEPGDYAVIFEPAAVAEMLLFYGWLAGNGLSFAEKRSFHKGELGMKLLDTKLTITEDPFHPALGGTPFDLEGSARTRVALVDHGVIAGVCHDRRSARLCGGQNTGHANAQPDSGGPRPENLVVSPGDRTLGQMIADTPRGLLVTKLHYTNVVNALDVSITGMTRAGTYLIENGKPVHAVKNMRFTQSLLSALAHIDALGSESHPTGGALFGGNFVVPAMKLARWRFSSPTGF